MDLSRSRAQASERLKSMSGAQSRHQPPDSVPFPVFAHLGMASLRGTCYRYLLCLTILPVCAASGAHSQEQRLLDSIAFFQKSLQVQPLISEDAKAALVAKLEGDPEMRSALADLVNTQTEFRTMLVKHFQGLVASTLPIADSAASSDGQSGATLEATSVRGADGSAGALDAASTLLQLLDAAGSDDFLRNFTRMSGDVQEVSQWLEQTGRGKMDLFILAENGSSNETFLVDASRFLRGWRHLKANFMAELVRRIARHTRSTPKELDTSRLASTAMYLYSNISKLAPTLSSIPPPNVSTAGEEVSCASMNRIVKAGRLDDKALDNQLQSVEKSQKRMALIGQAFGGILPDDDPVKREITPRLLLTIEQMLNYTSGVVEGYGSFNRQLHEKFAPLVMARLGCSVDEPLQLRSSAGGLGPGLLTVALSLASLHAFL
uniref:Uncharacterized protein n=1 Tax=Pyrodinium bahamense TaxID=73915 RepID=A0A7S0FW45_9DINO|mmetsp:Transcript_47680/g.132693  ORF Transcript_47680/g.132693 Transcript_47680/m.132693 type:complete len:434 (+) Transcript_47680:1-1302(+)